MAVKWLDVPEDHDYDAAADYLSLVSEADTTSKTVDALRTAGTSLRKAKDILRAARLALLPAANQHVKADLAKIAEGKKLSPILLVRGKAVDGVALEIADGYHRVCASYLTDENTPIPCRLVSWQTPG
jgi:indole-3-glycerol phosphate synthase